MPPLFPIPEAQLSTVRKWLAIDPKGVIGEGEHKVGAILRNLDLNQFNDAELKQL